MKILIIKPSSLGDVVQALPVLRLLRRHFPQSEIFWCIESSLAPLLFDDPDLAGLIPFDRRRLPYPSGWPLLWQGIRSLRKETFDLVIDLQSLFRSGLLAWLANGSTLIGLDDCREGAHGFYDACVRRPSYHTHAVDWYLSVLRLLQVPVSWDFEWLPRHAKAARSVEVKWHPAPGPWLMLQPGARWENKRWPLEHFLQLVQLLLVQQPDLHFAILGSSADHPLGQAIAALSPERCLDLTGQTSLREMVEWIRLSQGLVTNDTGPMHIAAALRKPVVALFGPTEPRRTGPYGQPQNVLQSGLSCVPCLKARCHREPFCECLRALSPESACARVLQQLNGAPIE